MRRLRTFLVLLTAAVGAAGCSGPPQAASESKGSESRAEAVNDFSSLLARLRGAGLSAKAGKEVEQPFFSVPAKVIEVDGDEVQVFEYPDTATAGAQAALVSPTGTGIGTTRIQWIGPPHFYKQGKILVLYVGDNPKVLNALEGALGRPFARAAPNAMNCASLY